MAAVSRFGDGHEKAQRAQNNSALENIVPVVATDSVFYLEPVPRKARGTFVVHFVGALCRKWPETARFDKVFDKGSRQSGLNRWFWDKLYLELVTTVRNRAFVGKLCRNRPFSTDLRQSVSTKIDDKVGTESFGTSSN